MATSPPKYTAACGTGYVREGPLLVWNGQEDIATAINEAGVWTEPGRDFSFGKMFDENPNSCWHS